MLTVVGVVGIPAENQIKEYPIGDGCVLNFTVAARDHDKDEYHRYQANMWVPKDEVGRWRGLLRTGAVFQITNGKWSMKEREEGKNPYPQLRLSHKDFRLLVSPK